MNYFKVSKFFLYLVPFTVAIVIVSTLFPFIVGKYVWFRTSIDLALIFFLLGLLFNHQHQSAEISINQRLKSLFKHPLIIAVTIFVFFFLLASLFAFDSQTAFWSNFERGEGGFQIFHLWLFFLLSIMLFREEKDWQKLFVVSLIAGVLMALYGLAAGLGWQGFVGPAFDDSAYRFQGSIGNPAYVASYAIFLIFYALYLLSTKYLHKFRSAGAIFLYILIAVFLIVFWAAATRGSFIGLIAAIAAFVGYLVFVHKKWRKWLISGVVILLLVVSLLVAFRDTPFVKSIPGSRLFDISVTVDTFRHRLLAWGMALEGWKQRPLLGWGPENYNQVFDRNFDPKFFEPSQGFGAWFDRAHSIYFDYLVETGILGLLSYLGIFVVLYWFILKKAFNDSVFQKALMFALPVAYLVQGLVLFDVLPIHLNLFLFLAFATYKFSILNSKF